MSKFNQAEFESEAKKLVATQGLVQWFVDLVKLCGEYLNVLVKGD